jgi:hypothetical protein
MLRWLIDYLRFYVPLENFSLTWRRHHCRWRAAKFRPMLSTQGLWAGRDLYRATPAVTRDLGFSGLIRRTAPFSRLLRLTRGCGRPILTRILTTFFLQNFEEMGDGRLQSLGCSCRIGSETNRFIYLKIDLLIVQCIYIRCYTMSRYMQQYVAITDLSLSTLKWIWNCP